MGDGAHAGDCAADAPPDFKSAAIAWSAKPYGSLASFEAANIRAELIDGLSIQAAWDWRELMQKKWIVGTLLGCTAMLATAAYAAPVESADDRIELAQTNTVLDVVSGKWISADGDCESTYIDITISESQDILNITFVDDDDRSTLPHTLSDVAEKTANATAEDGTRWLIDVLGANLMTSSNGNVTNNWFRCE